MNTRKLPEFFDVEDFDDDSFMNEIHGTSDIEGSFLIANRANQILAEYLKECEAVYKYRIFGGWYDKEVENTHKLSLGDEKPSHKALLFGVERIGE